MGFEQSPQNQALMSLGLNLLGTAGRQDPFASLASGASNAMQSYQAAVENQRRQEEAKRLAEMEAARLALAQQQHQLDTRRFDTDQAAEQERRELMKAERLNTMGRAKTLGASILAHPNFNPARIQEVRGLMEFGDEQRLQQIASEFNEEQMEPIRRQQALEEMQQELNLQAAKEIRVTREKEALRQDRAPALRVDAGPTLQQQIAEIRRLQGPILKRNMAELPSQTELVLQEQAKGMNLEDAQISARARYADMVKQVQESSYLDAEQQYRNRYSRLTDNPLGERDQQAAQLLAQQFKASGIQSEEELLNHPSVATLTPAEKELLLAAWRAQ